MIADLTGRTVVIVAAAAPLGEALVDAFAAHGAIVAAVEKGSFGAHLDDLARSGRHLDTLVHGAPDIPVINGLEDYSEDRLLGAISREAWPVVACLLRARSVLGRFPRHTVALSSSTLDRPGAAFSAAAGAVLESLCRQLSERLAGEGSHFNLVRHRALPADADRLPDRLIATPEDVANAAVALCSGWMDSMCGQVLTVDRGAGFCDNVFRPYAERAECGR